MNSDCERMFCDSCGDQILDEKDFIRVYGHDYCPDCYHDDNPGENHEDDDYYHFPDAIDCGFDPYMGTYTGDC